MEVTGQSCSTELVEYNRVFIQKDCILGEWHFNNDYIPSPGNWLLSWIIYKVRNFQSVRGHVECSCFNSTTLHPSQALNTMVLTCVIDFHGSNTPSYTTSVHDQGRLRHQLAVKVCDTLQQIVLRMLLSLQKILKRESAVTYIGVLFLQWSVSSPVMSDVTSVRNMLQ